MRDLAGKWKESHERSSSIVNGHIAANISRHSVNKPCLVSHDNESYRQTFGRPLEKFKFGFQTLSFLSKA